MLKTFAVDNITKLIRPLFSFQAIQLFLAITIPYSYFPFCIMKFTSFLGAALLAQQAVSHPGESHEEHVKEVQQRNAYLNSHKRSLAHCADVLKKRGNDVLMHARRNAKVEQLRKKRSISQGTLQKESH